MPFEFSGAPPALLDTQEAAVNFSSFSRQGGSNNATLAPATASPFAAFGQRATFGRASPFAITPAVGTHNSASSGAIASTSGDAQLSVTSSNSSAESGPENLLTRALARAAKSRPAVFGRKEVAADTVLKDLVSTDKADVVALLASMREADASPVAALALSMFTKLVEVKATPEPQYSPKSPPPQREVRLVLDLDSHDPIQRAVPTTAGQQTDHCEPPWDVPRRHDLVMSLEVSIGEHLRKHFVHYDEGAIVLAKYIIDEFYANVDIDKLADDFQESTGCTDRNLVVNLLTVLWTDLRGVSDVFKRDSYDLDAREDAGDPDEEGADVEEGADDLESETVESDVDDEISEQDECGEKKAAFRFLDLPAELRNRVYSHQLAPQGYIALGYRETSTGHLAGRGSTYKLSSACQLYILRTCHQVYDEAKSVLYRENTLLLTAKISISNRCIFSHHVLPPHVLPQLASVTMVCDYHDSEYDGETWLENSCYMRALQNLKTLRNLRICVVQREDSRGNSAFLKLLLKNIMDRVPADCVVDFESVKVHEIDYVQDVIDMLDAHRQFSRRTLLEAYEVEGGLLAKLADEVKDTKGCSNGLARDFRYPERPVLKSVQELIAAGEVDPKMVLGGSQ